MTLQSHVERAGAGLALLLGLSGCGGGGGPTPPPVAPVAKQAYQLSQTTLHCEIELGQTCDDIVVTAQALPGVPDVEPSWFEHVNGLSVGVVKTMARIKQSDGSWRLTLAMTPGLPAGVYTGWVQLTVEGTYTLVSEYASIHMNYTVTVADKAGKPAPLARLAGAADWEGYGGNAGHTGLVPVTLDSGKFKRRWTWTGLPTDALSNDIASPVVSANGLAYFSQIGAVNLGGVPSNVTASAVMALNESDGTPHWRYQVADVNLGPATVSGPRLVVGGNKTLFSFDALHGNKLASAMQPDAAGALTTYAPVLLAGSVYFGGRDGIGSADEFSAASRWSTSFGLPLRSPAMTNWTPAVNGAVALSNNNGKLGAYDVANGRQLFSVDVPGGAPGAVSKGSLNQAPVLVDAGTVLLLNQRQASNQALDNHLSLVDLNRRQLRWSVNGQFTTQPVVGGGVLYVGNGGTGQIEARKVGDASLLWSWAPAQQDSFRGDMILTNNLLFVATGRKTYAIDLNTHQTVWSYRASGTLSLSANGLLYIMDPTVSNGRRYLSAIDLH